MGIDYNAVFGIAPGEGGQEQEVADPAPLGGQEQELTDPADQKEPITTPAQTDGPAEGGTEQKPNTEALKEPLTPEQKHEAAAQRRKQELDKTVKDALEKYKAERDAEDRRIYAQLGLKNPETKQVLTDREEILKHISKAEESAMQKRLQEGKLTKEDLQTIILQTPEIQQMQARAQQAETANRAMQEQAFEKTAQAELAAIRRYDQGITGLNDIVAKSGSEKFIQLVQSGVSYLDAYRATWADEIAANAKNAGAAVARGATAGKDHLHSTLQRGDGGVEVPQNVKALYRQMMPNATEAEIRAHYNQYHK